MIEDAESIQKYGLVQKVMKQSDKEDISAEAQKALVSVENSGSVSGVPNDFRAVSGYSIIVQDEVSGLYGQFYKAILIPLPMEKRKWILPWLLKI